jgi:choline-sulfatase
VILSLLACGTPAVAPATLDSDAASATSDHPNVVLVTLDTTRADRIGAWGHAAATTPNIDKLAARGRLYRETWSPLPLTIPAHSALFTGRYPPRLGIRSNGDSKLGPEALTLAEILHENGWETGAATSGFVTSRQWGFDQGFDFYDDAVPDDPDNFWHAERAGGVTVDKALEWKGKDHSRPLFLWVHLYDAHFPYAPPSPFKEQHAGRPYDGELAYVDHQVGRIVDAFADTPTVFVVVGDHGEGLGDHGELNHGLYAYPSTQHVPLVIAGVGVKPAVIDQTTSLVDVLPTLLGLLGVAIPPDIDGKTSPGEVHPAYVESYQVRDRFGLAPQIGIIDGADELLDVPDPELFDVVTDPLAEKNRAKAEPDRVIALRKRLLAFGFPPAPPPRSVDPAATGALAALGYVEGSFDGDLSKPLPDAKPAREWITRSLRADRLRADGQLAEAAKMLDVLTREHPEITELKARQAEVLFSMNRVPEAEPLMDAVLAKDPKNPAMRAAKANLLARRGRLGEASQMFQDLAREQPYSPRLRVMAVATLLDAPETAEQGVTLAEGFLEDHPGDSGLSGVLGVHYYKIAQFDKAVPLLMTGAKAAQPQPQVCFALASLERGLDRKKDALDLLAREFDTYPRNQAAGLALLQEASEQRDWVRTTSTAERLSRLDPNNVSLRHARAQGLFNQQKYAEARIVLDEARKLFPQSADLWMLDANLLAKEGHRDLAQQSFEKATELRKKEAEAAPKVVPEPTHSRPWEDDQKRAPEPTDPE